MKYCPDCGSEYLDEVKICNDCNTELVSEGEYLERRGAEDAERDKVRKLTRVCVLESRFEADLMRNALDKEDITFVIKEFRDTAYDGLYIPQRGWGAVLVFDAQALRAEKIIADIKEDFIDGKNNK